MSLGKNLAKLAIPLILLSGCSTAYEGKIEKEYVKFMEKFGLVGEFGNRWFKVYDYLEITKKGDQGLANRNLIQYFDWNKDGKIDEIQIQIGIGNISNFVTNKETKKMFEIGQKEYDKYTKVKIPEAKKREIEEKIKILTN